MAYRRACPLIGLQVHESPFKPSHEDDRLKLAFLIGTGRCGSTLVHEILARHPAFGFVSNLEDNLPHINRLGRWNRSLYRSHLGWATQKGSIRFAPSEAYRIIGREVSMIYNNSCRDLDAEDVTPWLSQRFRRFFIERAEAQHVDYFLHKYTGWSRLGFFNSIFPDAKFVHIVRDGRAVANSWLQMPWWGGYRGPENWLWGALPAPLAAEWEREDRSFVALAGLGWKLLLDATSLAAKNLSADHYLLVRFEDIVERPSESLQRILSFLDLPANAEFDNALAKYRFSCARRSAFEQDISIKQVSCLNRLLGETLNQYGYKI